MKDRTTENIGREATAAAALLAELDINDAEALHDLIEGETNLLEAIGAALAEIDECEIIAAGCKAKEAQIEERRRRVEARAAKVRAAIEQAMVMAELATARLPLATLTVRELAPKPIVTDESLIPSQFWEPQPPKLDKKALSEAAKVGPVPGVEMSNGSVSLTIRRA